MQKTKFLTGMNEVQMDINLARIWLNMLFNRDFFTVHSRKSTHIINNFIIYSIILYNIPYYYIPVECACKRAMATCLMLHVNGAEP